MASDQLVRWLLLISAQLFLQTCLHSGRCFKQPTCVSHTLLAPSKLSRTLGGRVTDHYGPCLRNWQSASFLLNPSNPNYSKKINPKLKPGSWMLFLFGKGQFSAENYPWQKQLLTPSFSPPSKIKCSDESQQPLDPFPAKWWQTSKKIMINHPKPFPANKQDCLGAIPNVHIYSNIRYGLS